MRSGRDPDSSHSSFEEVPLSLDGLIRKVVRVTQLAQIQ